MRISDWSSDVCSSDLTRASLQLVTVADQDGRTIRNLVALTLATIGIDDADFTGTRDSDQQAVLVGDGLEVVYARGTGSTRVDTVRRRRARSRAADVEGTHRQLGTRLTDRLCGDRKSTRLNSSHSCASLMPSSA